MSVVALIDDDDSVRRALARRLTTAGLAVEVFASAMDYLDRARDLAVSCIVTDLRMPGMSGLDLQAALAGAGCDVPLIFISGDGDVPTSVAAMRGGAVHFLTKPFTDSEMLAAIREALDRWAQLSDERTAAQAVASAYATLTPREREVFALVADGLINKVIADRLGAAEKTIKIHRARVMTKMGARSVAHLVRMAARLSPSDARTA